MHWIVWLVVGISIGLILAIVLPLSPRIRKEPPLDPADEADVLLGRDPADRKTASGPEREHRDFDPGEIRALRELGDGTE